LNRITKTESNPTHQRPQWCQLGSPWRKEESQSHKLCILCVYSYKVREGMVVMKGDIVINSRKEHQNMTKGGCLHYCFFCLYVWLFKTDWTLCCVLFAFKFSCWYTIGNHYLGDRNSVHPERCDYTTVGHISTIWLRSNDYYF
jgi:hypothetical protein